VAYVNLEPAQRLEAALERWRQAIAKPRETSAPVELRQWLWQPLAAQLPPGTRTVYLAPDVDLARLPWDALPGEKLESILLEQLALALVQHGPWMLEQLWPGEKPDRAPGERLLLMGGLDYGTGSGFGFLPGTARELDQVKELAGQRPPGVLWGGNASPARLQADLPRGRWAHLATHGFFDRERLVEDWRRQERQRKEWQLREESGSAGLGLALRGDYQEPAERD